MAKGLGYTRITVPGRPELNNLPSIIKIGGFPLEDVMATKEEVQKQEADTRAKARSTTAYVTCSTAASTKAKTVTIDGYELAPGGSMKIKFDNANTDASPTLNISGTGAKPLYYKGEQASSSNSWPAGATLEVYYDGEKYMANDEIERIEKEVEKKIDSPASPGTSGQILSLDNEQKPVWVNPASGSVIDSEMSDVSENPVQNKVITQALRNGTLIPAIAENLASWEDEITPVANSWPQTIRTTAGDDPINTDDGGVLKGLSAGNGVDFICDAIATTGYNQLRLVADGGQAKSLSSDAARVIPIPHLDFGSFGSAEHNNGMLFTQKPAGYTGGFVFGGADIQPTVRFVPLADGEPDSTSDGEVVTPTAVSYQDKTYHTYLTSGEGWLIVTPPSGVAWSDICAHIAWEDWYDRFVSPTDEADDSGDSISLTPLATALSTLNGTGKLLYLSPTVFTKAERTSGTTLLVTETVGRVTSPVWTNTLQDDGETYLHTLTISGMKSDGAARIEGSQQYLTISGATISYADQNADAISGAVRYELATPATATVMLEKTSYTLNDCGVEIKVEAVGSGYAECEYTQNIPDALSQIAKVKLDASLRVIAEALLELYNENKGLKAMLNDPTRRINAEEYYSIGFPMMLSAAGAPNASVTPNEWNTETMGVWTGVPTVPGQEYFDTQNNKWYKAKKNLNGATADWLLLN